METLKKQLESSKKPKYNFFGRKISSLEAIFISIIFSITFLTLITTFGVLNSREGDIKLNTAASYPLDQSNFDGLLISAKLTNIDINSFRYTVHFDLSVSGSFKGTTPGTSSSSIAILLGRNQVSITQSSYISSSDQVFIYTYGDSNQYPFDVYNDTWKIQATIPQTNISVPIAITYSGAIQGYSIDLNVTDEYILKTIVKRSVTTKFLSIMIIIILWVLSIAIFIVSLLIYTGNGSIDPPVYVPTSLLFSLPAVRNMQPGIPLVGCTADVVGFYWNAAIVAVSAVLMLIDYCKIHKREFSVSRIVNVKERKED